MVNFYSQSLKEKEYGIEIGDELVVRHLGT